MVQQASPKASNKQTAATNQTQKTSSKAATNQTNQTASRQKLTPVAAKVPKPTPSAAFAAPAKKNQLANNNKNTVQVTKTLRPVPQPARPTQKQVATNNTKFCPVTEIKKYLAVLDEAALKEIFAHTKVHLREAGVARAKADKYAQEKKTRAEMWWNLRHQTLNSQKKQPVEEMKFSRRYLKSWSRAENFDWSANGLPEVPLIRPRFWERPLCLDWSAPGVPKIQFPVGVPFAKVNKKRARAARAMNGAAKTANGAKKGAAKTNGAKANGNGMHGPALTNGAARHANGVHTNGGVAGKHAANGGGAANKKKATYTNGGKSAYPVDWDVVGTLSTDVEDDVDWKALEMISRKSSDHIPEFHDADDLVEPLLVDWSTQHMPCADGVVRLPKRRANAPHRARARQGLHHNFVQTRCRHRLPNMETDPKAATAVALVEKNLAPDNYHAAILEKKRVYAAVFNPAHRVRKMSGGIQQPACQNLRRRQ